MDPSNATAASNPQILLVRVPIAELRQDPQNARSHDRRNLDAIKESLAKFGQVLPVVVRHGQIVGGNATTIAADELGWTHLDVTPADHLTAEEAVALAIALNRTAELASWDASVLVDALAGLPTLEGTGFTAEELAELEQALGGVGAGQGLTDPDEVPEPPVEPVTRPGDLWLLGPHRLLCGDATKAEDVERLMAGEQAVLMKTDPPYGVSYDAEWRGEMGLNPMGANRTGKVAHDDEPDWTPAWKLAPVDVVYVWHASAFADVVMTSLRDAGFEIRQQIIWHKTIPIISRSAYNWHHEPCWYAVRKGATANWQGDHTQTTVWTEPSPNHIMSTSQDARTPHPTQKPVALYERAIANHTVRGDLIYDPFVGSGSAVIAAHRTGRRCNALELDPAYVDLIARRWQEHTGEKPILEATGEPHDFVSPEVEVR